MSLYILKKHKEMVSVYLAYLNINVGVCVDIFVGVYVVLGRYIVIYIGV